MPFGVLRQFRPSRPSGVCCAYPFAQRANRLPRACGLGEKSPGEHRAVMLKIKILQKCIFSDPNPALQAKFLQKYNIFGRKRAYRLG
jgi:hypothetical protein